MNRDARLVVIALLLLFFTSWSPLIEPVDVELSKIDNIEKRYDIINVDPNQLHDWKVNDYSEIEIKNRPSEAWTRIGVFDSEGF